MSADGFFDDVRHLAGLDSRAAAERVATRVLHVIGRHLSRTVAEQLAAYLPLRAAHAVTEPANGKGRMGEVQELLQEVAVDAETSDPADARAYLGAVLTALQDCVPMAVLATLPAEVLDVALAQAGHRCLLCSPLPWPKEAAS